MEKYAQLERFFTAADELITGKFILADTKIGELLKAVAASDELTQLFAAATEGYDYPAAKRAYLCPPDGRGVARGEAYLPDDRGEVLAFVFCLLAEIDAGKLKLGDFLLRYFYEDGSYTASYERFVNKMIKPFRDIVRDCYPMQPAAPRAGFAAMESAIARERTRVKNSALAPEDAVAADKMLSAMQSALGRKDLPCLKALLCGYLYFLQMTGFSDENSDALFAAAEEF